jgi:hypothetical protein
MVGKVSLARARIYIWGAGVSRVRAYINMGWLYISAADAPKGQKHLAQGSALGLIMSEYVAL